jgi:hypothetical protein
MHRHAPKRHAAVSFVVTHEGCGSQAQQSGDDGSGAGKYGTDRRGQKIDRIGSPQSGATTPPLASGTPDNHSLMANLDIGGPLLSTGSTPGKAPQVVPN